jgi:aminoglycoside phosphotransferase (APT) family kinase protein
MNEQVASALERAFPDRDVAEIGPTGPSWNDTNRTVRIEFADGESMYLKVATDGDGTGVARECAAIAYADANSEVPVPEILASDADGAVPYLATAPMTGRNLLDGWAESGGDEDCDADVDRQPDADHESDADRKLDPNCESSPRVTMARKVGRALASVHAVRFESHGHVVGGDADGLELRTGAWTDVLVEQIGDVRSLASSDRFDHHFDEVIAAVEANRDVLEDAPAAFVHGDPARPNCVRDDGRIGFIDWENAHVGDPARDLYRARDQQFGGLRSDGPEQVVAAFHDGYRERAGGLPDGFAERRPVYEAVRFLGRSGFFDKWVEFADESSDELAALMREEMARRLNEI